MSGSQAHPLPPLRPACRLSVVIPARDEAASLARTLTALSRQCDRDGRLLPADIFDVIVFANNCADATAAIARACAAYAPHVPIQVVESDLPGATAHIGAARRYVMDLAAGRFLAAGRPEGLIASTDADTVVDTQWIAWTLREARGADAVGGHVAIADDEQQRLLAPVRLLYARELRYQRLVAEVEAYIDPRPEDPLPRHRAFVGASFAVSARTYVAAGRLPRLRRLEDRHFYHALRRIDARIRHSPFVRATTSPRVCARVDGGFGSFLGRLHDNAGRGESFTVEHPRQTLRGIASRAALRQWWSGDVNEIDPVWRAQLPAARVDLTRLRARSATFGAFYEAVVACAAWPAEPDVNVEEAIEVLRAAAQRLDVAQEKRGPRAADAR